MKEHGGPVSPNELHKLDNLTESEVLQEVIFFRQTIAPNIREKRKVENKFVKYTKSELIQQIKSVLKPEAEEVGNLDTLLKNSAKDKSQAAEEPGDQPVGGEELIDTVALFEGPLGERKVGVVLSKDTLQFYHSTRYGFQPEDLTSLLGDWKIKGE